MGVLRPFRQKPARAIVALLAFLLTAMLCSSAKAAISKEYQVKAVFIFNFTQFVKWPPTAFTAPDQPFRIGILGEDPYGDFLDETVKGEKVGTHPLVVQRCGRAEDARNCQILFIGRSEMGHLKEIFATLKGRNILTIGDAEGFVRAGGITRFVTEKNKVHLRISPKNAKKARLTVSSQILRLAEIVDYKE